MADAKNIRSARAPRERRTSPRPAWVIADKPVDVVETDFIRAVRNPTDLRAILSRSDVNSRLRTAVHLQRTIGNQAVTALLSTQRQGPAFDEETVDDPRRYSVVAAAEGELGKVAAKRAGEIDSDTGRRLRVGWEDLDRYFEASYGGKPGSGYTPELQRRVKFRDAPWSQHWCGHFSVWALKAGDINIGNWVVGGGISSVSGMRSTTKPKPGDVGYIAQPYQHHFIVAKVEGSTVHSIDGNSGTDSEITRHTRSRGAVNGFYRPDGVT